MKFQLINLIWRHWNICGRSIYMLTNKKQTKTGRLESNPTKLIVNYKIFDIKKVFDSSHIHTQYNIIIIYNILVAHT